MSQNFKTLWKKRKDFKKDFYKSDFIKLDD